MSFESLILLRNLVWTKIRGFDSGGGSSPITGPVGIAQATGEVVEEAGWVYLIEFSASISMSLAVLNFLPIPAVDGGRLFFVFVEFLRRGRRVAPQREALVHFIGLAALLVVFLIVTYFDVLRIVNGDSLLR
jgi:regulator of sigma E protease